MFSIFTECPSTDISERIVCEDPLFRTVNSNMSDSSFVCTSAITNFSGVEELEDAFVVDCDGRLLVLVVFDGKE